MDLLKKEGYYHEFGDSSRAFRRVLYEMDSTKIEKELYDRINKMSDDYEHSTKKNEILSQSEKLFEEVAKIEPTSFDTIVKYDIPLEGKSQFFAYPSLHRENGIAVNLEVNNFQTSFPIGNISLGNRNYEVKTKVDLQVNYDKVTDRKEFFIIPVDNVNDNIYAALNMKGQGTVKLDGVNQGETWLDKFTAQLIAFLATLIGGIAVLMKLYTAKNE